MSHTSPAPTIRVFGSAPHLDYRPHNSQHSLFNPSNAIPMAIPNAREAPPPPLPPPRYIGSLEEGQDPGWRYGNSRRNGMNTNGPYTSVKPGSSLLGGGQTEEEYTPYDYRDSRRGSTMSSSTLLDAEMQGADGFDHSDEDRNSRTRPNLSNFRYVNAQREQWFLRKK